MRGLALGVLLVCAPPADAVDGLGLFELDGNADDAVAGLPDDFTSIRAGTPSAGAISWFFSHDRIVSVDGNDQILTGGATKDSENIPSWRWTTANSIQAKNDIANGYAANYVYLGPDSGPHRTGDIVYYLGADIAPGTGASNLSFWLLQDSGVALLAGGTVGGAHQDYDVLVQANIAADGSVATTVFYWLGGTLVTYAAAAQCNGANPIACGVANTADLAVPAGWPTPTTTWVTGKYYEAGINISALMRALSQAESCFVSTLVATRASPSISATLTDVVLTNLQVCATDARLRAFDADARGRARFVIEARRDTRAFALYGGNDPQGRDARLLAEVEARPTAGTGPVVYETTLAAGGDRYVHLEEHGARARRRLATAWVGDPEGRERVDRELAWLGAASNDAAVAEARRERGRPPATPHPRMGGSLGALKVETRGAGLARVPLAVLTAAGLPEDALGRLELTRLGSPVPFEVRTESDGSRTLAFEALGLSSDYSDREVHVVRWDGPPAPAPSVSLTRSGFGPLPRSTRIEPASLYVPFVERTADAWVWDLVTADQGPAAFRFDLPGWATAGPVASVPVQVGLVGGADQRHTVSAALNGVALGQVSFEGLGMAAIAASVPAHALRERDNELVLEYSSDGPFGLLLLDLLDVGVVLPRSGASLVRVAPYDAGVGLAPATRYLVLAHGAFLDAAQRIADAKSAAGLTAQVVDVERAYDRHSGGVYEARALHALLREGLGRERRLAYVLLLGDDSFDPRDHAGLGARALVPSLVGWDGLFGRVPSESLLADLDGDGAPELAVGRLPAGDALEAEALAEKVLAQDALLARGRGRQTFAVDNRAPGEFNFGQAAQQVAAGMPSGTQVHFADVGAGLGAARTALLEGLTEGRALTHYFGHGGPEQWADEGLLRSSDAAALAHSARATVLLSWTCQSDWYQYDLRPSLAETLLLVPEGGAVAAFGPSGISEPVLQRMLYRRVYDLLAVGLPLGEAIQRAKSDTVHSHPQARPVIEGFNLLGDPALRPPITP